MMSNKVRSASFAAVRMAHRYPWKPGAAGIAGMGAGAGLDALGWPDPSVVLMPGGLTLTAGCTAYWWIRYVGRPHSTRAAISRRAELDQRCGGVATPLDVAELAGPSALRRQAHVLRPSMAGLSRWQRRHVDPRQLGVEVARLGWGLPGQSVWSSCEDATLRIAPPRQGKSVSLACHGVDAPGALLTTSTRLDLAEIVHAARSARGPVYFFNPAGIGEVPSTLRWRVLSGCEDYTTAQRRAADLVPQSMVAEAERWDADARRILSLLLHAAALSGRTMRDVVRWNADHSETTKAEVTQALLDGGPGGRDRVTAMRQHWGTNDRTRTSVTAMMNAPLAWVRDDTARPLGDPDPDDPAQVDLGNLILRGQTVHLLGSESQTGIAPLIAALVAEIAHTARMLAEVRPGGRLDPPLTMLLDEIALVCPIPLDKWTADMGGRGVTLHAAVQSLAQLRQRWGLDGAGTILGNVGTFLVYGGSTSPADLRDISQLTGEHRMRVVGIDHRQDHDRDGELRGEYRWVPVLSQAQIRALEPNQVLILKRGLHTLTGWAPRIIDRPGWKAVNLRPVDPIEAELTTSSTGTGVKLASLRAWLARRRPTAAPSATPASAPDTVPVPVDNAPALSTEQARVVASNGTRP
ncbi:MAG: TraM recognition protein [Actinomycetota bacterium]|nr:TraM recognition protein [Actinomycetota bacterium]